MLIQDFDEKVFRQALGQFPTGVTVISAVDEDGSAVGMTASSFNSVSMDPPLIIWCVNNSALSAPVFTAADYFAVNVLTESQVNMSNRFASRGEDKFDGVDYHLSENGAPLFNNCAAQFECKRWAVYEGGDHKIIVGEVIGLQHSADLKPLVYAQGQYAMVRDLPS